MKKQKILTLLSVIVSANQAFVNARAAQVIKNTQMPSEQMHNSMKEKFLKKIQTSNKKQVISLSNSNRAKLDKHPSISYKIWKNKSDINFFETIKSEIEAGDKYGALANQHVLNFIQTKAKNDAILAEYLAQYQRDLKNEKRYKDDRNYAKLLELKECKFRIKQIKRTLKTLEAQAASSGKNYQQVCANLTNAKKALKEMSKKDPNQKEVCALHLKNIETFLKNDPLKKTSEEIKNIKKASIQDLMMMRAKKYNLAPAQAEQFTTLAMSTREVMNNINVDRLNALKKINSAYVNENNKITKSGRKWLNTAKGKAFWAQYEEQKRLAGKEHESNANKINPQRQKAIPSAKTVAKKENRIKRNQNAVKENYTNQSLDNKKAKKSVTKNTEKTQKSEGVQNRKTSKIQPNTKVSKVQPNRKTSTSTKSVK